MCEQTEVQYLEGDVVWVKLGKSWWPGEVQDFEKIDDDIKNAFKKPPIAVVKFFQEDTFEYVKNLDNIYKYNCRKKHEFIKKGLDKYRKDNDFMKKFPADIVTAEELTNGDPNILNSDEFQPEQKKNYNDIFGTPSPKKTPKDKGKSRQSDKLERVIFTRPYIQKTDYGVTYLEQNTPPPNTSKYTCHICGYTATRLNVMVLHNKSHIRGYVSPTTKRVVPKKRGVSRKATKLKFANTSSIEEDIQLIRQGYMLSGTESSDSDLEDEIIEKPTKSPTKRVQKVQKSKPPAKKAKVNTSVVCSDLLAEWSDNDNEDHESEKKSEEADSQDKPQETQTSTEKSENISSALLADWDANSDTELSETKTEAKETTENGKDCFDFKEEEFTVLQKSPGRKIPRVIPHKRKSIDKILDSTEEESELNSTKEKEAEKEPEQETEIDQEAFANLLEETAVPNLPSIESLKSEQNFQLAKPQKSPDKVTDKVDESEKTNGVLKETRDISDCPIPKKRFARNFEDFELFQNEQTVETSQEDKSNLEFSKMRSQLMTKLQDTQSPVEEKKTRGRSKTKQNQIIEEILEEGLKQHQEAQIENQSATKDEEEVKDAVKETRRGRRSLKNKQDAPETTTTTTAEESQEDEGPKSPIHEIPTKKARHAAEKDALEASRSPNRDETQENQPRRGRGAKEVLDSQEKPEASTRKGKRETISQKELSEGLKSPIPEAETSRKGNNVQSKKDESKNLDEVPETPRRGRHHKETIKSPIPEEKPSRKGRQTKEIPEEVQESPARRGRGRPPKEAPQLTETPKEEVEETSVPVRKGRHGKEETPMSPKTQEEPETAPNSVQEREVPVSRRGRSLKEKEIIETPMSPKIQDAPVFETSQKDAETPVRESRRGRPPKEKEPVETPMSPKIHESESVETSEKDKEIPVRESSRRGRPPKEVIETPMSPKIQDVIEEPQSSSHKEKEPDQVEADKEIVKETPSRTRVRLGVRGRPPKVKEVIDTPMSPRHELEETVQKETPVRESRRGRPIKEKETVETPMSPKIQEESTSTETEQKEIKELEIPKTETEEAPKETPIKEATTRRGRRKEKELPEMTDIKEPIQESTQEKEPEEIQSPAYEAIETTPVQSQVEEIPPTNVEEVPPQSSIEEQEIVPKSPQEPEIPDTPARRRRGRKGSKTQEKPEEIPLEESQKEVLTTVVEDIQAPIQEEVKETRRGRGRRSSKLHEKIPEPEKVQEVLVQEVPEVQLLEELVQIPLEEPVVAPEEVIKSPPRRRGRRDSKALEKEWKALEEVEKLPVVAEMEVTEEIPPPIEEATAPLEEVKVEAPVKRGRGRRPSRFQEKTQEPVHVQPEQIQPAQPEEIVLPEVQSAAVPEENVIREQAQPETLQQEQAQSEHVLEGVVLQDVPTETIQIQLEEKPAEVISKGRRSRKEKQIQKLDPELEDTSKVDTFKEIKTIEPKSRRRNKRYSQEEIEDIEMRKDVTQVKNEDSSVDKIVLNDTDTTQPPEKDISLLQESLPTPPIQQTPTQTEVPVEAPTEMEHKVEEVVEEVSESVVEEKPLESVQQEVIEKLELSKVEMDHHENLLGLATLATVSEIFETQKPLPIPPKEKKVATLASFSMDFDSNETKVDDVPIEENVITETIPFEPEIKSVEPEVQSSPSKLLEILTEKKKLAPKPIMKQNMLITADKNLVKLDKNSKFIIKSTKTPSKSNKPIILSEKIIKPVTETETVSVRKVTSKRTYQDVEDIDTFIIEKPSKKSNLGGDEDIILTPKSEVKQIKGRATARGKPKIIEQTIIKAADIPSTETGPLLDDAMFDINSMPIVLADQIPTADTIEKMPVISEIPKPESTILKRGGMLQQVKLLKKPTPTTPDPKKPQTVIKGIIPTNLQKNQKVYASSTKLLKSNPAVITQPGKPGKFIIRPSSSPSSSTGSKYTVGKRIAMKSPSEAPKMKSLQGLSPEPSGNKIMIITNNQGEQSRVLLTPAQQKMLAGKMPTTKITKTKGVVPKSILTSKGTLMPVSQSQKQLVTQAIMTSKGQFIPMQGQTLVTSEGQVLTPLTPQQLKSMKTDPKLQQRKIQRQIILPEKLPESKNKIISGKKTILLKSSPQATYKKLEPHSKQVVISSTIKSDKPKPIEKAVVPQKPLPSKVKGKAISPPKTQNVPPLAPITKEEPKKEEAEQKHLIIQDNMGNQTTVTEGQILALPRETVDGQPQSYMLVTVDESGNLVPLSNEALMSLDPNLAQGGDLNNLVLQFDQNQAGAGPEPEKATETPVEQVIDEPFQQEVVEQAMDYGESQIPEVQAHPETEEQVEQQTLACNISTGETSQQLIITGDPESTQKFLASLSEGNTDLSSLLTGTDGNIIINADGQQILLNTGDPESQILLMPTSTSDINSPSTSIYDSQIKNQDILAAALADTDVFQQDQEKEKTSQLSPGSSIFPGVGNVLETSLTLSSPIMTPLEVPSSNKIKDPEATIIVPSSLELPITITDPSIAQTVSQQVMLSNELQTNLELPISVSETIQTSEMSSNFVYTLPNLDEKVAITSESVYNSLAGSMSMPLLTEETEGQGGEKEESDAKLEESSVAEMTKKLTTLTNTLEMSPIGEDLDLQSNDICDSLSEPPPGMFEKASFLHDSYQESDLHDNVSKNDEILSESSPKFDIDMEENSCEIPIQPQIITSLTDNVLEHTSVEDLNQPLTKSDD